MDKFWEVFAGKLAEKWFTEAVAPSMLFWFAVVVAIYSLDHNVFAERLRDFESAKYPLLYVAAALLVVVASAALVERILPALIRVQEGYYWWLLGRPFRKFHEGRRKSLNTSAGNFLTPVSGDPDKLSDEKRARYVAADRASKMYPNDKHDVMPTLLGNVLRAAEMQPRYRYGLDIILCWPRLWLVLPDVSRSEISQSRSQLDEGVRMWLWTLIFGIVLAAMRAPWWTYPLIVVALYSIYFYEIRVAQVYGSLLVSVFDLYRSSLYQSAGIEPPKTFAEEKSYGEALTMLFDRGIAGALRHANGKTETPAGSIEEMEWAIGPLRWRLSRKPVALGDQ